MRGPERKDERTGRKKSKKGRKTKRPEQREE